MAALLLTLSLVASAPFVAATPEPHTTPRAGLHMDARQNTDPALVGWASTSDASEFSTPRRCSYPATLSRSGSFAQCCETSKPCDFFTSCADGNVIAASTSVFCDQGYCNTAVIVGTLGAKSGPSFLGCWPTSYGQDPFTFVQDIGSAPIVSPTASSGSRSSQSESSTASTGRATRTPAASVSSSATQSSETSPTAATNTPGAAAAGVTQPLTGLVGLVAGLFALL